MLGTELWTKEDEQRYIMACEIRARHHRRMKLFWLASIIVLTVMLAVLWAIQ